MLYKLAHIIRDHFGFLWDWMEWMNAVVFGILYRSKLKRVEEVLEKDSTETYRQRKAVGKDASRLAAFFAAQPEQDFTYFRPHGFEEHELKKLLNRASFQMFVVEEEMTIVGYFFLRSFCNGQCYLGKMVDHNHQGKGIGKLMCKAAMDVATVEGLRMYESINKDNRASMKSSSAVLKQVIVKELEDGDLLIEDLPLD